MINSKYSNLNVLSNDHIAKLQDMNNEYAVNQVNAMLNTSGNRAQKRRLEKTLRKVERVQAKCEESARKRADKELAVRVDNDFLYLVSAVGLTLYEDYRWREDPEQEHGQITSFFERLERKIETYSNEGLTTEDIISLLEEKTGIVLGSKNSEGRQ